MTSADDLYESGDLYLGPDSSDRTNEGSYEALQDLTVSANSLGG
ncbi:MAG: hypothetical protein ACFB21_13450 [Opitutales bacterium]